MSLTETVILIAMLSSTSMLSMVYVLFTHGRLIRKLHKDVIDLSEELTELRDDLTG